MKPLRDRQVWFAAGSQEMYGERALATVAADSTVIAAALEASASIPVSIVRRPTMTSPDAIRRLMLEANASDACVGVIAWMHTFSPAKMWIAGLGILQKPLLHLHTQFNRDLPWAEIDMDYMNLHQSAHGDREFGYIETRMGLARKTVVGDWRAPDVLERIGDWGRAACGAAEARQLGVARFGDNMRQVAVTEGDKVEAQIRLGVSVNGYGVGDLVEAIAEAPDARVTVLASEYEDAYVVAPELRVDGARHRSLRDAARIELGLRAFLERGGFGAFTNTFEDLRGLTQLPGIATQRLMADGYGFGAEGDWKTAALLRVLKVMGQGLPGGTSFMEDYTYHLEPGNETVLGSHMLEVCPSIADGRPTCEIHPLSIGGREDPVRLVFTAAPGPAFVVGILDLGDRFRLVVNEVDVISPQEDLPRLPVARATWKPEPDFATAAEAWLLAGGPHHTVFSSALGMGALIDLAEIMGVELLVVDRTTRMRDFKNELRWNRAYHQLARGLDAARS